ncbi:hypothetical protein GBAR_LOCUS27781 [Geodia barretti]|uniref:Uncharacterized protein n=1 Tax=Geodia barretti TaxID=519541 RepID=A0AA35TLZ7_GEOBA|nr:hypothetical protein GBAR_LOCUS27781 [Geodia barretti]
MYCMTANAFFSGGYTASGTPGSFITGRWESSEGTMQSSPTKKASMLTSWPHVSNIALARVAKYICEERTPTNRVFLKRYSCLRCVGCSRRIGFPVCLGANSEKRYFFVSRFSRSNCLGSAGSGSGKRGGGGNSGSWKRSRERQAEVLESLARKKRREKTMPTRRPPANSSKDAALITRPVLDSTLPGG